MEEMSTRNVSTPDNIPDSQSAKKDTNIPVLCNSSPTEDVDVAQDQQEQNTLERIQQPCQLSNNKPAQDQWTNLNTEIVNLGFEGNTIQVLHTSSPTPNRAETDKTQACNTGEDSDMVAESQIVEEEENLSCQDNRGPTNSNCDNAYVADINTTSTE